MAHLLAEAGVEEHLVLAGPVGLLALHGGLEGGTAEVARAAADRGGASLYAVVQPPTLRWHLPSTRCRPDQAPALAAFLHHVDVVISVHGYGRRDRPRDVLVGGIDRARAAVVAERLRHHLPDWVVVDDLDAMPPAMRGLHPANPVNLAGRGGVQLELPPELRGTTWRWADTTPSSPLPELVEGIAAAVLALAHR